MHKRVTHIKKWRWKRKLPLFKRSHCSYANAKFALSGSGIFISGTNFHYKGCWISLMFSGLTWGCLSLDSDDPCPRPQDELGGPIWQI